MWPFVRRILLTGCRSVLNTPCTSNFISLRRQKARERQQKLLAEFASRQKSFMETAMDVGKSKV